MMTPYLHYLRLGARYPRAAFSPRFNPLIRGEADFILSPDGAALIVFSGGEALFAMPWARSGDAADGLVTALLDRAKARRCAHVLGPVSPHSFDLHHGLRLAPPDSGYTSPFDEPYCPFIEPALRRSGFEPIQTSVLYGLDDVPVSLAAVEKYVTARWGLRSVSARASGPWAAIEIMAALSADDPELGVDVKGLTRALTDPGATWDTALTFLAFRADEPVGYLIALRKGRVIRAATAFVAPAWRRRGVTALMGAALGRALRGRFLELGVIDEGNAASRLSVENLGARRLETYARFCLELARHISTQNSPKL